VEWKSADRLNYTNHRFHFFLLVFVTIKKLVVVLFHRIEILTEKKMSSEATDANVVTLTDNKTDIKTPLISTVSTLSTLGAKKACDAACVASASASASMVKTMDDVDGPDELMCAVCRGLFCVPVTAQCQHTFCQECLETIHSSGHDDLQGANPSVPCPLCRRIFVLPPLSTKNLIIDKLVNAHLGNAKHEERQQEWERRKLAILQKREDNKRSIIAPDQKDQNIANNGLPQIHLTPNNNYNNYNVFSPRPIVNQHPVQPMIRQIYHHAPVQQMPIVEPTPCETHQSFCQRLKDALLSPQLPIWIAVFLLCVLAYQTL